MSTSRWLLNWFSTIFIHVVKAGGYQAIHPRTFQMSRKILRCQAKKTSTETQFFNFTSDVHNKFHTGLSEQHYTESTIIEDTRRISHDDYQLSTKLIRRKRLEIMETERDF